MKNVKLDAQSGQESGEAEVVTMSMQVTVGEDGKGEITVGSRGSTLGHPLPFAESKFYAPQQVASPLRGTFFFEDPEGTPFFVTFMDGAFALATFYQTTDPEPQYGYAYGFALKGDFRPPDPGPAGSPLAGLPIPSNEQENVKHGQQFDCQAGHRGLDFGFDYEAASGEFSFHDVVSPFDGIVEEVSPGEMTNGIWIVSVRISYSSEWSTLLAFEPGNNDQAVKDRQLLEIVARRGQAVKRGQLIGRLVVPSEIDPRAPKAHVHWGIQRWDPATDQGQDNMCPRTYSTAESAAALDAIYEQAGLLPVCVTEESCPNGP